MLLWTAETLASCTSSFWPFKAMAPLIIRPSSDLKHHLLLLAARLYCSSAVLSSPVGQAKARRLCCSERSRKLCVWYGIRSRVPTSASFEEQVLQRGGGYSVEGLGVVVEVDGPSHFLLRVDTDRSTLATNGSTRLKHRLLEEMGWRVKFP